MSPSTSPDVRQYRPVFQKHPDAIIISDPRTLGILAANAAAARLYGYRLAELERMGIDDLRPPDQIPRLKRFLARSPRSFSSRGALHRKKSGELFEAEVTGHRMRYGGREAYFVVVRDVTSRNRAACALAESEGRFRALVEATKDYAIYMLDAKGFITSWNEGARRLKGYRADEVLGRHFSIFYTAADVARGLPMRLLRRAAAEGRATYRERRVRKDRTRFLADVVITPLLDDAGRLRGFAKVTRDTTAEDAAAAAVDVSRAIVCAEEAERRRIARELHDGVNQLLASARFRIKDEEERVPADHPGGASMAKARAMLDTAITEVRRISKNLRPLVLDDLGLRAALRGLCADFNGTTRASVRLDCRRMPRVLDEEVELALFRIAQEALNNAARHSRARRIRLVVAKAGPSVLLKVRDDGEGFRQNAKASGLRGMRERAEFLGGSLEVKSAPGRGTVVTASLPERR